MRRQIPFWALTAAGFVSNFGNILTNLAIPWFVLETTGSPSAAGITGFFSVLPSVLAGLFGGPIIDRLGFKRMSIVSDLLSCGTVALIPLFYQAGWLTFWSLQVLVFLGALLDAPGTTARVSILPEVSREAQMPLERASAVRELVNQSASLIGPLVGGVLLTFVSATDVLWVNACTFVISALLIAACVPGRLVPAPARTDENRPASYFAQWKEGFRFIRTDQVLMTTMGAIALANFVLGQLDSVLLPTYGNQVAQSSTALGTIVAAFSAGAMAGAALYAAVGPRLSRRTVFLACWALQGCCLLGWGLLPSLPFMIAVAVLFGLVFSPTNPLVSTVALERIPVDMRGRVGGLINALTWIALPLGPMIGGFTTEAWGLRPTFLSVGAIYLLLGLVQFFMPGLRAMDQTRPVSSQS